MAPGYSEADTETITTFVRTRVREREAARAELLAKARADCDAVVARISRDVGPERIYVWGSLVQTRHFSELSDIDIAVEGAPDATRLYEVAAETQRMTDFDLDIVRIESIHPAYADFVRRRGRVVYERARQG
jgi:predicted nucleotidyltransferase